MLRGLAIRLPALLFLGEPRSAVAADAIELEVLRTRTRAREGACVSASARPAQFEKACQTIDLDDEVRRGCSSA